MIKMYLLAFDYKNPQNNAAMVRAYLKDNRYIDGWLNSIPGVWMFLSELSPNDIRDKLSFVLFESYFVIEVKAENVDGILPQEDWEWIFSHQKVAENSNVDLSADRLIEP